MRPPQPFAGEVSRRLNEVEEILGKYVRITRGASPIRKYRDEAGAVAVVVKFAQARSYRGVAGFIKERREALSGKVDAIVFMFDCDAPVDQCEKYNHVSGELGCARRDGCCREGLSILGVCGVVYVLALAPRLEDVDDCTCICCHGMGSTGSASN